MKKLVLAALLACVSAFPAIADKVTPGEMAEFKGMIDRYALTWSTLNPDSAGVLYAKDADLVFYDLAPLKYAGWSEYNKGVRDVFAGFETMTLTPSTDLKVTRQGKIAWTTVTYHTSVKPKGGDPMQMDARQTLIWEKRDGKWLIVHEHFSAPLPPEEKK